MARKQKEFVPQPKAPCTLDQETRDLLTRAASAAGIRIVEWVGNQANVTLPDKAALYGWNPLTSWGGGEALALAVKLRIAMIPLEGGGWDCIWHDPDEGYREKVLATCANSGAWALQEAIVTAAAKLDRAPGVGPSAPPTYFCNKCGYHGPVQTGHQRPNGSGECGYMAVLIAGVRVESTPLADFIRNATPEEKAKVYGEIMDEVGRQQRAVIDGVQTPDGEQR